MGNSTIVLTGDPSILPGTNRMLMAAVLAASPSSSTDAATYGRASTPTVLPLDDHWNERGCFIERPPALRDWILENPEDLNDSDIFERKMAWYDEDAGRQTLEEVLAILESAAQGDTRCGKQ